MHVTILLGLFQTIAFEMIFFFRYGKLLFLKDMRFFK